MSDEYYQWASEVLDYPFDWTDILNGTIDAINTSTFTVEPTGLTITSPAATHDATTATVWATGGTPGATYKVYNTIVTVGGRTFKDFIRIRVRNN